MITVSSGHAKPPSIAGRFWFFKGTSVFEAELHYLKARMRGGLLNKAKRGEPKIAIPIGYVYKDDGKISKDPDVQVQEAIMLFFNTFTRIGSAHHLVREYERQGILFPHREHKGFKLGELSWKKINISTALWTIKNPMYTGTYAFGRTQVQHSVNGRKSKKCQMTNIMRGYQILIRPILVKLNLNKTIGSLKGKLVQDPILNMAGLFAKVRHCCKALRFAGNAEER